MTLRVSCQADSVSSSRYSWKFDKNKDKSETETKGYTFSKHGKSKCLTDSD